MKFQNHSKFTKIISIFLFIFLIGTYSNVSAVSSTTPPTNFISSAWNSFTGAIGDVFHSIFGAKDKVVAPVVNNITNITNILPQTPPVPLSGEAKPTPPTTIIQQISQAGLTGSQGKMGIQGPKGDKGDRGASGLNADISNLVTQSTFDNQVNGLLSSIEKNVKSLSDSLSAEVDTALLNVTGDTTLVGLLDVTGATTLNGNTSITGSNTFTVGTGLSTLGGGLNVSGNVGIGTTGPVSKLTLNGVAGANPNAGAEVEYSNALTFQSNALYTIGAIKMVQSNGYYIDNGSMTFSVGSSGAAERMRIDQGGNVGIGTMSPRSALNVAGTTALNWANGTGLTTIGTGGTGGSLFVNTPGYNNVNISGLGVDGSFSGSTSVVNLKAYGTRSAGGYNSALTFSTTKNTTLTEWMRIDQNGSVGIGMTAPTQKLDVVGNINIDGASAYMYGGQQVLKFVKGTDVDYANTLVGEYAGSLISTASRQTAVGGYAGYGNTGNYQVAIGYNAGGGNTGVSQTAIGNVAGLSNTGASQTAVGYYAGKSNTGVSQTAIGVNAGQSNTGAYQTAVGFNAGYQNTGTQVTGLGYEATYGNTANDVVAIGYRAGKNNTVANQFIVQQANINAVPLIQGNFSTGNVGIGLTTPTAVIHIKAGTATANTAPLKFTSGALLTTPEAGAVEYDNSGYYGTVSLNVGDSYGGGKIAYILQPSDPGYDATQVKGIIAATSDQSTGIIWHATNTGVTGASGIAIGTGLSNTNAIIALYGAESNAATLARNYRGGGYTDWYLPSLDELNKLYLNKVAIGGFENLQYWSSSEQGSQYAWYEYFDAGGQYVPIKNNTFHVRAIRSFAISSTRQKFAFSSDVSNLYLPYSGATSNVNLGVNNLTVDTNSLFVDSVNHRVGLGTLTPTNALSFDGTTSHTLWMERNTTAATAGLGLTLSSGGATLATTDKAGGDLILKSGISTGTGDSALRFFTATPQGSTNTTDNTPTEKMTILGNGNVGIGITNPVTALQVYSSGTGGNPATSGSVQNVAGQIARLMTNNVTTLDIGANGDSGVWLQSAHYNNLATNYPIKLNPNGGAVYIGKSGALSSRSLQIYGYSDTIPLQEWGDGNTVYTRIGRTVNNIMYMSQGNQGGSDFEFRGNYNFINQVKFPGSGIWNSSGNVGIGVTVPGAKLDVVGNSSTTGIRTTLSTDSNYYANLYVNDAGNINLTTTGGSSNLYLTPITNTIISNGNLSIGTATVPGNKLTITGADDTIPALGTNGGKLGIFNGAGNGSYGLVGGVLGSGNVFLQAQTISSTGIAYNMLLQPNGGNVGIGTTSPTSRLHLAAGTLALAPLGFTSGPLLTTPLAGKVEFLNDAYYGTITTGAARKTFAFLESPTFTGTVTTPAIKITTGANNGYVLKSDASGNGTWQSTSGMTYKGAWDATANSPTLADGTGTAGDMYAVSVGGTQFTRTFVAGGWAVYNGAIWEPVGTSASVTAVNSLAGIVQLNPSIAGNILSITGGAATADLGSISTIGNAGTVTTNANLTGAITSVGNATILGTSSFSSANLLGALSDKTGTGLAVFGTSPTLTTPILGVATGTTLALGGATIGTNALATFGDINIRTHNITFNTANTYVGGAVDNELTVQGFNKLSLQTNPSATDGYISFLPKGVEKVRIDSTGNVGIGTTAPGYKLEVNGNIANYVGAFINDGNSADRSGILIQSGLDDNSAVGPSTLIGFNDGDATSIGSITFGSNAVAYNTTSDERLKTLVNEQTLSSLNVLNQIAIHDFTWNNDTSNDIYTGVFAQELYGIYPHAVTKPIKDSDNWMVDYSKLTPVIIASIQELSLKVNDLSSIDTTSATSLGSLITSFLGDEINRINKIFTKEIDTQNLCVSDSTGARTCITKAELDALLSGAKGITAPSAPAVPETPAVPAAPVVPVSPATPITPIVPVVPAPAEPAAPAIVAPAEPVVVAPAVPETPATPAQ